MPLKVKQKQDDGTEVEVDAFTEEELQAKAEERAKTIAQQQVAEAQEKFENEKLEIESKSLEHEEALKKAQEELDKLKKKDYNFEQLRKKASQRTDEEEKVFKRMEDLQKTVDEIQKAPLEAAKSQFIQQNIGADKELADKFEFFYKKLASGAKTMEEVNTALIGAFSAATGGTRQPDTSGRMVRTGVSDNFTDNGAKVESEASREFGAMLGISAEDKKKAAESGVLKTGSVPLV